MRMFLGPIKVALILFPVLAMFLTTPYMIYEYRKRGSINVVRTVVVFAFIYYLMNAYFLVILPLPDPDSVHNGYRAMMQLQPFQFVQNLKNYWVLQIRDSSTYLPALIQPVFTQCVFNILLTVPFGMFLRYYFKFGFIKTVLASFCLSLFFELSQLTGLFFIYSGPYRLFDVDDLILNTFGGIVGYVVAPVIHLFFPTRDHIDDKTKQTAQRVSLIKRVFIFSLDLLIIKAIYSLSTLFSTKHPSLVEFLIFIAYFVISYSCFKGQTVVSRFFKVRLESSTESLTTSQILCRSLLVYFFIYKGGYALTLFDKLLETTSNLTALLLYFGVLAVVALLVVIYIIYILVTKNDVLFYDKMTKTKLVSLFKEDNNEDYRSKPNIS